MGRRKKASGLGGWRPGAGRKPEIEGGVTKSVVLDEDSLAVIEAYQAKQAECSISKATRGLIRAGAWVLDE